MNKYSTSKYISTLNNISYEFDPCCNSLKNQSNPLRNNPNEVIQFLNKNNGNFLNVISCPPLCNCDCHFTKCNKCKCNDNNYEIMRQLNLLCQNYSDLQVTYNQLLNDYYQLQNKQNSADSYIQNLENEINKNNNVKSKNYYFPNNNTDNNSYVQMMNNSFDKIIKPLSDLSRNQNSKLIGGIDFYSNRPDDFNLVLNSLQNMLLKNYNVIL